MVAFLVVFLMFVLSSVTGRVQNALNGESIPDATVILGCTKTKAAGAACSQLQTQTNRDGLFRFDGVAPGSYVLIPSAKRFSNGSMQAAVVEVEADQQPAFATLTLNPLASIRGKVVNEAGAPMAGVSVVAWRIQRLAGHTMLYKNAKAATDPNGQYSFDGVGKGSYYVTAELPRKGLRSTVNFLFFSGALSVDQATALRIEAGESTDSIDFKLRDVETHRISGKVVGLEDREDRKDVALSLEPFSPAVRLVASLQEIELQPDGSFVVDGVMPGSYLIRLRSSRPVPTADSTASTFTVHQLATYNIEVGHGDVAGVMIVPVPPILVSGHVVVEGSDPLDLSQVRVTLRPAAFEASSTIARAAASKDGTIRFPGCDAAKYAVQVSIPAGHYVSAMESNGRPLTGHLVDLSNGTNGELMIRVASGSAEISGRISGSTGESSPAKAAQRVMLIPDDWNPEGGVDVSSYLSKDGSYDFKGQSPGRYAVVAAEWSESSWPLRREPELVRYLQNEGKPVELRIGDHRQLDVPLIREEELLRAAARLGLH